MNVREKARKENVKKKLMDIDRIMAQVILEVIKAIRIENNLTQKHMARIIGLGEVSYCRWESGISTPNLTFPQVLRLSCYLESHNISLMQLLKKSEQIAHERKKSQSIAIERSIAA